MTKNSIFDQNLDFWPKYRFLTKSSIYDQNLFRKLFGTLNFALRNDEDEISTDVLYSENVHISETAENVEISGNVENSKYREIIQKYGLRPNLEQSDKTLRTRAVKMVKQNRFW